MRNNVLFQGEGASFNVNTNNFVQMGGQKKPDGKRSPLFCSHCKRNGHTVERCYKLHGYPNSGRQSGRPRAFRGANNVWTDAEKSDDPTAVAVPALPGLNQEQSRQLLQFITNLTTNVNQSQKEEEANASAAYMAGINQALRAIHCLNTVGYDAWILDSGASEHMCSEKTVLQDLCDLQCPIYVKLPNRTQVKVTKHGRLSINDSLLLNRVLLVPNFKFNLLSIRRLCEQLRCSVEFSEDFCFLQGHFQKKPLVIGSCVEGLYVLDRNMIQEAQWRFQQATSETTRHNKSLNNCNAVTSASEFSIWHSRLGHMSFGKMKLVSQHLNYCSNKRDFVCQVCPKAKQHRLPFPSSSILATSIFELLHIDTWGPYHTKTPAGHRYFLTIVDDFSRGTWTHLMVTKDEALTLIKRFVAMAKTQFGKTVKIIRSDNALELARSFEALSFFAETGIKHETTCIHTLQQNGVVKRKHKHLLEVSRALMFQSSMPLKYWGECVLTATYLINRMPTKVLKGKTPFEILFGQIPSYDHLRVFGSLCFMTTPKQGRDKFQDRAKTCVFIGYPFGKKGYKVLELATSKIHESRDVVFHENVFPFAESEKDGKDNPFILAPSQNINVIDEVSGQEIRQEAATGSKDTAPAEVEQPIRRSTRQHTMPQYLSDYVCCNDVQSKACCCTLTNLSVRPK